MLQWLAAVHHVFLIPGFFGFANFGDLKYFAHVRQRVDEAYARGGAPVRIHYVTTSPTASLRKRAARVVDAIAAAETEEGDALHLLGHSTGGIDARLAVSPEVELPTDADVESLTARVRSVVAIASPHYGTPLARLFTSIMGQSLLRALSLMTLHGIRLGTVPVSAVVALAGAAARLGGLQGPLSAMINQVYKQLLRDFDSERRDQLEAFFREAESDQTLLPQLSPEGMDVLNAVITRRASTRYGCVVTRARPPAWRAQISIGVSPAAHGMYALYRALYELTSTMPELSAPRPSPEQGDALRRAYGDVPEASANDAIVPTRSQVYGDVVHACWGDHLDVIGHFGDASTDPPHVDWIGTRTGFARPEFDALWDDVTRFLQRD